nr:immunoglobulin heavy chain junction region [Macaca mulatta]
CARQDIATVIFDYW